jgi:DNA mismatch repair protein MutS
MAANIVTEYFNISNQYQAIYGPSTVVLYMVGSFYEIYSLQNPSTQTIEDITPIVNVCDICNLNIANKQSTLGDSKEHTTINTPELPPFPKYPASDKEIRQWLSQFPPMPVVMAGFRDYSLDKYLDKLVSNGYTVVVFNQEKIQQPNSKKEIVQRKLLNIFSPGTYLSSAMSPAILTNNIMCIWMEQIKQHRSHTNNLVCGIANCNILTAETHMFEYQTPLDNSHTTILPTSLDELERIVSSYRPNECILIANFSLENVPKLLGIDSNTKVHQIVLDNHNNPHLSDTTIRNKALNATKQTYIENLLKIFYKEGTYQSCKEFQENAIATQAFCFLLDFIQEHNSNLVKRLNFPIFSNTSTRLILANQTLRQLNIIPNGSHAGHLSSVETFLNKCSTAMGKRLFKYQLLNPTFDHGHLKNQYDMIEYVLANFDQETLLNIRRSLSSIKDLERMNRQIIAKRSPPTTLLALSKSLATFKEIEESVILLPKQSRFQDFVYDSSQKRPPIDDFLNFLNSKFFLDKIGTDEDDVDKIRPGVSLSLDLLLTQQNNLLNNLQQIQKYFSNLIQDPLKLHETEKNGYSLQLTKKRAILLKQILAKMAGDSKLKIADDITLDPHSIKIHHASTNCDEIDFPELRQIAKEIQQNKEELKIRYNQVYLDILEEIESSWYEFLYRISQEVARIDVLFNKAFLAREYKYCKPTLAPCDTSFVRCKTMRHALIEHIQKSEVYVPNDAVFDTNQEGMILTGYNGIGKSSFIRALGICIILAQSGMYVPCEEMVFKPYEALYCCIEKRDNLFKNMSTFQLEMSELRVILNRANEYSLILGDELMNSTEAQSGISIMIAVLEELSRKRASFIIATHYNQLEDYEEIQALRNLQMKHMNVVYDHANQILVYDRRLKDGLGNRSYGLEVARSLFLADDFMESAFQIRNKYFPKNEGILSKTTSKYNSEKIKGACEECGINLGSEVHHILEQHKADKEGYIGHVHKNHLANLKTLCEKCHKKKHHHT